MLKVTHLDGVFDSYSSVEAARIASWPWRANGVGAGGALLCGLLVWIGLRWGGALALASGGAVLKLTLTSDRYDWEFTPVSGTRDAGTGTCH